MVPVPLKDAKCLHNKQGENSDMVNCEKLSERSEARANISDSGKMLSAYLEQRHVLAIIYLAHSTAQSKCVHVRFILTSVKTFAS